MSLARELFSDIHQLYVQSALAGMRKALDRVAEFAGQDLPVRLRALAGRGAASLARRLGIPTSDEVRALYEAMDRLVLAAEELEKAEP